MTTEIEKQFFNTFGIEPKSVKRTLKLAMPGYDESDLPEDLRQFISSQAQVYHVYPQITDRILLELICTTKGLVITEDCNSVEQLKNGVLKVLINLAQVNNDIKHQVLTLFKEW